MRLRRPATLSIHLEGQPPFSRLAWIQFLAFLQALVRPESELVISGLEPACPVRAHLERAGFPLPGARSPFFRDHRPDLSPTEAFATGSGAELLSRKLLLQCDRIHIEPVSLPLHINPSVYRDLQQATHLNDKLQRAAEAVDPRHGPASARRFLAERDVAPRRVTLITSAFRGNNEIAGFLSNSAALRGYRDDEHLLIRPGSPGNEHAALLDHVRRWPSALYINLPEDPGLYAVWNFGARLATAKYLSNANLDDRRAPEQLEVLVEELERHPMCAVASTAMRVSDNPETDWEQSEGLPRFFGNEPDQTYGPEKLLKKTREGLETRALPHCMPLWRRELHGRYGYFNEDFYGPSADIEFWLRAGSRGERFRFLQQPLGLFRRDPASYWHRNADRPRFTARIIARYGVLHGDPSAAVPCADAQLFSRHINELRTLLEGGAGFEAIGCLLRLALEARRMHGNSALMALVNRMVQQHFGLPEYNTGQLAERVRLSGEHFTHHHVLTVVTELLEEIANETRHTRTAQNPSALQVPAQAMVDIETFSLPALVARCRRKLPEPFEGIREHKLLRNRLGGTTAP